MANARSDKNKRRFSLSSTAAGESGSVGEGVARELVQAEHSGEGELQSIRLDRIQTSSVNPRKLPVDAAWVRELGNRARANAGRQPGEPADDEILDHLDSAIAELDDVRVRTSMESLMVLTRSIHIARLISPVTVRYVEGSGYELVAGERRYLAHVLLGRTNIRALLRRIDANNPTDALNSEITSLMENVAREDLTMAEQINAIDRIVSAKQRLDPEWELNGANLMRLLHQPRRRAYRYLDALTAPPEVRAQINDGTLDSFRSIEEARNRLEGSQPADSPRDPDNPSRSGTDEPGKPRRPVSVRLDPDDLPVLGELIRSGLSAQETQALGMEGVDWTDAKAVRKALKRVCESRREGGSK